MSSSVYVDNFLSYFLWILITSIVISIFEKIDIKGKDVLLIFKKWVWSICKQFWKNIKQDYNVIFYDVFFLFLIIFIISFYYIWIFEILVFLFTFVLFVYFIGKFFWLQLSYQISKKDLSENKKIIIFLFLVMGVIWYGYFQSLPSNYMDAFKKEVIHPFEDPEVNIPDLPLPMDDIFYDNNIIPEEEIEPQASFDISMFSENLSLWSQWENVKILQLFLNDAWYYNFTLHGIYDEMTQIAMKRFLASECDWSQTNQWILWPQARICIQDFLEKK